MLALAIVCAHPKLRHRVCLVCDRPFQYHSNIPDASPLDNYLLLLVRRLAPSPWEPGFDKLMPELQFLRNYTSQSSNDRARTAQVTCAKI